MFSSDNHREGRGSGEPLYLLSLLQLLSVVGKYWKALALGGLFTLLYNLANLGQPILFKMLFETIFQTKSMFQLNSLIIAAVILYVLKAVFQYGQMYLLNLVNSYVVMELQNKLYYKLLQLKVKEFDRGRSGDLYSRMFNDVNLVSSELSILVINTLNSALTLLGAVIWITWKNWSLALLTFTVIPLIGYLVRKFSGIMGSVTKSYQEKLSDLSSLFSEVITGIRTLKAFAKEEEEADKFFKENRELFNRRMSMVRVLATHRPLVELTASMGIILISWYGGYLVVKGLMTPGDILAYWGYVAISVTPATILSSSIVNWRKVAVAVSRIFELINSEEIERGGQVPASEVKGKVTFEDVWLSYGSNDSYELKGISFTLEPGEKVAIVGPTGSGKTSIISLLLRFYDPAKGRVLIDDLDIKAYDLRTLRKAIGVVLQEPFIFRGTVRENIAYPKPNATMEEIIEAAKKAQIHEEILNFPNGYDTLIGERGATLSGGQRQRIAIARLFLMNPRILLLDEPTSALDLDTERELQLALKELMKGRTTIIITHRASLVKFVDRVLIVVNGKLIQELPPEVISNDLELMRKLSEVT